ncbi:MAG: sigma-70 family RNA polymerase sigma factor [Ignavibacteria bacterium]|nr:sigma-70 family RNA polymerase sigma factor [Ignavibacteria bacterium]
MTAADERILLRQAQEGSHQAFGRLVESHMKPAYNIAFRFVNDHHMAEEIAQDAFVRAHQSLDSFRGESGFGTWIYRIVVNLSLNAVKARRRRTLRFGSPEKIVPGRNGSDTREGEPLVRMHLNNAVDSLPQLQRKVVILRHIEGYSTREVSEILQCSEGTVKTHLFRGLHKLRRMLRFLKEEKV